MAGADMRQQCCSDYVIMTGLERARRDKQYWYCFSEVSTDICTHRARRVCGSTWTLLCTPVYSYKVRSALAQCDAYTFARTIKQWTRNQCHSCLRRRKRMFVVCAKENDDVIAIESHC